MSLYLSWHYPPSHMPRYLWYNVILTYTYLLNRLPSSPLDGKDPLACLYLDCALFFLPSSVFWCVTFVHITRPYIQASSSLLQRVLFGYSLTKKAIIVPLSVVILLKLMFFIWRSRILVIVCVHSFVPRVLRRHLIHQIYLFAITYAFSIGVIFC